MREAYQGSGAEHRGSQKREPLVKCHRDRAPEICRSTTAAVLPAQQPKRTAFGAVEPQRSSSDRTVADASAFNTPAAVRVYNTARFCRRPTPLQVGM